MKENKFCKKCNKLKSTSDFGTNKSKKNGLTFYCRDCTRIYKKEWRSNNKEHIRIYYREWRDNNREKCNKWQHEYIKNNPDYQIYIKDYSLKNRERINLNSKKWRQTEVGREKNLSYVSGYYRNKKWIPLMDNPFPDEIKVEWHHINNMLVIPLPRITHRKMLGKNHVELCNNWIREYYLSDFISEY